MPSSRRAARPRAAPRSPARREAMARSSRATRARERPFDDGTAEVCEMFRRRGRAPPRRPHATPRRRCGPGAQIVRPAAGRARDPAAAKTTFRAKGRPDARALLGQPRPGSSADGSRRRRRDDASAATTFGPRRCRRPRSGAADPGSSAEGSRRHRGGAAAERPRQQSNGESRDRKKPRAGLHGAPATPGGLPKDGHARVGGLRGGLRGRRRGRGRGPACPGGPRGVLAPRRPVRGDDGGGVRPEDGAHDVAQRPDVSVLQTDGRVRRPASNISGLGTFREGGSRRRRGHNVGYSVGAGRPALCDARLGSFARVVRGDGMRRRRSCHADSPWSLRRRRGRDVDIPWRRVAAPPRLPRGYSVETSRAAAAAAFVASP